MRAQLRVSTNFLTVPRRSSVCPSIWRPHSLNIFSLETTGPIEAKFHMESPWDGGTKVYSKPWSHDQDGRHICPYMVKTLKKSSSPDPGLTLTYFTARSNLVPYAFVWEKGKTVDFSETIVIYDKKLATDDQNDNKFLLTSKLCPLGPVCPLPCGNIHVLNHEKSCITWKRFFWNLQQISKVIRPFCWHQNFVPGACLPLLWVYIHLLNHEKIV